MNVERKLLSRALMDKDITPLIDAKIRPDWFEDDQHGMLWGWMQEFFGRYGKPPSPQALRNNHPWFEVVKAQDPVEFYIEQFMRARKFAVMRNAVAEAGLHLKDYDPESALIVVQQAITELSLEMTPLRDINLSDPEYIERWKDEYEERATQDGTLIGLPTGFPTIDRASGGLRPEQLIVVGGTPGAGKSTSLLLMCKSVHDHGRSPLFIGFEMSNEEQRSRYAAIRANIDYHRLDRGTLTMEEERLFYKMLKDLEATPDLWLSADPSATSTVSGVRAKLEQYKPAVLFIDGVYLMMDEQTGEMGTPQALTHITRALKQTAQRYKIPIVISTQVLEWKYNKKKGVTTESIGYASSFAQDADVLLGLEKTDDDTRKKLRIAKGRHLRNFVVDLEWNWTTRQFEELSFYDPDEDEDSA